MRSVIVLKDIPFKLVNVRNDKKYIYQKIFHKVADFVRSDVKTKSEKKKKFYFGGFLSADFWQKL